MIIIFWKNLSFILRFVSFSFSFFVLTQMDTDCNICFLKHNSKECPERALQHCEDCDVFIKKVSDHSLTCGKKGWMYDPYANIYMKIPNEKWILSFNCAIRFLKDGTWRKAKEGLELCSSVSGVRLRFKSDNDLCLLSTSFVRVCIVIVVKETIGSEDVFYEKMILLSSFTRMVQAKDVDNVFNRNSTLQQAHDFHTTVVLAVAADQNPCVSVSAIPKLKPALHYKVKYDREWNQFLIPSELSVNANDYCSACYGTHHSKDCQERKFQSCSECHVPVKNVLDHSQNCGSKKRFESHFADVYIEIPVVRCTISFETPYFVLFNGSFSVVESEVEMMSTMTDSYFKLERRTITLSSTNFSRIRIPIFVEDELDSLLYYERLVLMTSYDRTLVAAKASRPIRGADVPADYKHNTPIVLCISGNKEANISIKVYSGTDILVHDIRFDPKKQKFEIPNVLQRYENIRCEKRFAIEKN